MQYVGRLMSTVYNSITPNINPATLSGAIDIIVVERKVKKDPSQEQQQQTKNAASTPTDHTGFSTELASTPFHVRFGKMSVLRPAERKVTLHLNGSPEPLPFHMKVGETGEAFFVLEVDDGDSDDIPDALVTSPLLSAASSPSGSPGAFGITPASSANNNNTNNNNNNNNAAAANSTGQDDSQSFDVEPLDLGASAVTPAEIQATRAATQAAVERSSSSASAAAGVSLDTDVSRLSLEDIEIDSADADVRSAAASSQRTAVEPIVPVTSKELDVMLDMDGYKVTGEVGQDHHRRHHHLSRLLHRAAQKADRVEAETELRRETERFFGKNAANGGSGGGHQCTLSSPLQAALDLANGPQNLIKPFELPSPRSRRASFDTGRESGDGNGDGQQRRQPSTDEILREFRSKAAALSGTGTPRSDSVAFETSDTVPGAPGAGEAADEDGEEEEDDISRRLLARAKSDPAIDLSAAAAAASSAGLDGHDVAEKIMDDVVHGPAGSIRNRNELIAAAAAASSAKASKKFIKTLRLSSDQLKSLNLKKGMNTISFSVTSSYSGVATCTARIFLWDSSFQVVVSDIDGTITKSDALGHVFTMIGRDWTHLGVAKLYTDVARNGYHMMYLTSRAIGQADITRDYLKGINQNGYRLPDGPVIMSPDRLIASLHREVILRKPEVFKMACLRDIARLFGCDFRNAPGHHHHGHHGGQGTAGAQGAAAAGAGAGGPGSTSSAGPPALSGALAPPTSAQAVGAELQTSTLESVAAAGAHNVQHHSSTPTPFFAGFGNRITDALSYRSVNVPSSRIFTIDWNGEVKMELLELAGYNTSYVKMNELVDQFFPPIRAAEVSNPRQREFNDVNYWRQPIEDFELPMEDLSPPVSPALSARSGRSIRSTISIASRRSLTTSVLPPEEGDFSSPSSAQQQQQQHQSDQQQQQRSPTAGNGSAERSTSRLSRFGLTSLGLRRGSSLAATPEPKSAATTRAPTPKDPAVLLEEGDGVPFPASADNGGDGDGAEADADTSGAGPGARASSSPDAMMDDDDPLLAQGEVRFDWK